MTVPIAAKKLRSDGFEALKQQRDAAAAELLSRYLDTVPDDVEAELALAVARSGQGKHAAALAIFERHLERDPKSPVLHFNRATTLERLGRKVDAVQAYELVLRLNPNHAKARLRLDALRGNTAKPVDGDDIPFVIAVDEDKVPVKLRRPGKVGRVHPGVIAAVALFVVMLIGLTVAFVRSVEVVGIGDHSMIAYVRQYPVTGVASSSILGSVFLLAGLQVAASARGKNLAAGLGYSTAAFGALVMFGLPAAVLGGAYARGSLRAPDLRIPDAKLTDPFESALADLRSGDATRTRYGTHYMGKVAPNDRRAEVAPLLESLLSSTDPLTAMNACDALGKWGTRDSIPILQRILKDKGKVSIQFNAREAIKKIQAREPAPPAKGQP